MNPSDSEPARRPGNRTGRGVILIFALGLLCSLSAVAIGLFGALNLTGTAISTAAVRRTSTEEARAQRRATQAVQLAEARLTQTAVASRAEPLPGWRLFLSEDFASNTRDWPVFSESNEYASITAEMADGVYRWNADAHRDFVWWAYPDSDETSDFLVRVRGRRVSGTMSGEYGVVFRLSDEAYYRFTVNDLGSFAVERHDSSGWSTMIPKTTSPEIHRGEFNLLTVSGSGDSFAFFINDQLVGHAQDARLAEGHIGITIGQGEAGDVAVFEFDDFEIWAP